VAIAESGDVVTMLGEGFLGLGHAVCETTLDGREDDLVTGDQLIDAVERRAVRGPMAGDGCVADVSRQRARRVEPRALAQVGDLDATNHHLVDIETRDLDPGDRIPVLGEEEGQHLGIEPYQRATVRARYSLGCGRGRVGLGRLSRRCFLRRCDVVARARPGR
jgi:hypothetical protein